MSVHSEAHHCSPEGYIGIIIIKLLKRPDKGWKTAFEKKKRGSIDGLFNVLFYLQVFCTYYHHLRMNDLKEEKVLVFFCYFFKLKLRFLHWPIGRIFHICFLKYYHIIVYSELQMHILHLRTNEMTYLCIESLMMLLGKDFRGKFWKITREHSNEMLPSIQCWIGMEGSSCFHEARF